MGNPSIQSRCGRPGVSCEAGLPETSSKCLMNHIYISSDVCLAKYCYIIIVCIYVYTDTYQTYTVCILYIYISHIGISHTHIYIYVSYSMYMYIFRIRIYICSFPHIYYKYIHIYTYHASFSTHIILYDIYHAVLKYHIKKIY
jgi:hypothetical protein